MKLEAKTLRWMEPIGQFFVLLAIGFQFFFLEPARSEMNKATFSEIDLALARIETAVSTGRFESRDATEAKLVAWDRLNKASEKQAGHVPLFAAIFLLGSSLIVVGKAASVKASSK